VRFVATLVLWLVTTVVLAVAVPTMWAQRNVVSEDGYAALATSAAKDSKLQSAMASELTTQITALAADNGYNLNSDLVRSVATAYTANAGFPGQFAQANRIAHRWMFTNSVQREEGSDERWLIDIAPMLNDSSLKQTLGTLDLEVPQTLTVPITVPETTGLQPGKLRPLSTWGPWVSVGATILTGVFALLMLASARARGKALAALGVSALLVGAAGWVAIEVTRRYVDDALNRTAGDIRQVADVMVNHAEDSLHQWLNLTLAAGGVLVVFGVIASMLGGLRRTD
jgi:competence protein ComGC